MTNDSSSVSSDFNFKVKGMSKPKSSTLNFIRQFARTCVTIQGCALGTMMLNWSAGQHRSFKINTRTLMKKPKGPDHPSGPLFFSPDHITQDLFLSSFINAGEEFKRVLNPLLFRIIGIYAQNSVRIILYVFKHITGFLDGFYDTPPHHSDRQVSWQKLLYRTS